MPDGDAHQWREFDGELRIKPSQEYEIAERPEHTTARALIIFVSSRPDVTGMPQFRYHRRTFLAPASSRTTSYIVAEIESSHGGVYALGTNMLTIADCHRRIQLESFLGNVRDRQQSLAKAELLAELINTFRDALREEARLIEKE